MLFNRQSVRELPFNRPGFHGRAIEEPRSNPGDLPMQGKILYRIGHAFLSAYLSLMLDVNIRHHAPMPDGPKILASNHPTSLDPFYILILLNEPVSVLVTAAIFDIPCFGRYVRATGHVPAIRGSGGATVDAVVQQIKAGRSVAIFPEGAISPIGGGFHRPHSGVARVALRTKAPVIPIGIGLQRTRIRVTEAEANGDRTICHFYTKGPYAMTVGGPLYLKGDASSWDDVGSAAFQIMCHIRRLAKESQHRVAQRSARAPSQEVNPYWLN